MNHTDSPVVDVTFPVRGTAPTASTLVPADHGYPLFAAIRTVLPWIHGDRRVGIHSLPGRAVGGRSVLLSPAACLTLRVPADLIPALLPLAGHVLDLAGTALMVGPPTVRALQPHGELASRLVVIHGQLDPANFVERAQSQLDQLGIHGDVQLARRRTATPVERTGVGGRGPWLRRTLQVSHRTIVGFAVEVRQLAAPDSLRLQAVGLGGRRRFGCGIFVPLNGSRS